MTQDEIRKLIPILMQVDGGCPACVRSVLEDLAEAFPETATESQMRYREEWSEELFEEKP